MFVNGGKDMSNLVGKLLCKLLMVIHTKYNGRRCGRQDLVFKTEYLLGRQEENTLFKRWK